MPNAPDPRSPATPVTRQPSPPVVDSRRLLGAQQRLLINHHGELYILRQTRQGKLILTK
jgi:hemin uptake protein HemP